MDIIVTYGTFSIIFILVTTDVMGDNWCGRFGLWPFRSVAVSVCGRSGLWPFRFVAVSVCGRSGLWPFQSVAVPVCGRFGLWPFRFVAVSVVAISVCGRYDLLPPQTVVFVEHLAQGNINENTNAPYALGSVNFSREGPVKRKAFPCHDVILDSRSTFVTSISVTIAS